MAKINSNLLELDNDKLFEERSIEEIIEIEKILDNEIEKKRNALRSMVGDRYKDVLAASDAIKSMKSISQEIVNYIDKITNTCEELIVAPVIIDSNTNLKSNKDTLKERTTIIQLRLAIFLNEEIWIALDEQKTLDAAQYYLLAQHIHTGLDLSEQELLAKIPFLEQIRATLEVLKGRIFRKITEKLEAVETTAEETSENLNALLLLENQSCDELFSMFMEHRATALNTVINTTYSSVRVQVYSMVKCLITTIYLLHDCFISSQSGEKGLIWQQLDEIVANEAPTTLSKVHLPITPLTLYIPDIIIQFRPKCQFSSKDAILNEAKQVVETWLQSTQENLMNGLEKSLQLIPNIRGLHYIREESLKIDLPDNWEEICKESYLPENFNIWTFFFQNLITSRCKSLICKKVFENVKHFQEYLKGMLKVTSRSAKSEADLRWYVWKEDPGDVSKTENSHKGLSMKTRGYSSNIVDLCNQMDCKYLELLQDTSQYLYGEEYNSDVNFKIVFKDFKFKRKFIDRTEIEDSLSDESTKIATRLSSFLIKTISNEKDELVPKSIMCARFLQAISNLCPHFQKCCTLNNSLENWPKVCDVFNKSSLILWQNWIREVTKETDKVCINIGDISPKSMVKILTRWDEIEIQEQTDEKIFTSQIKVPLKPSLALTENLNVLNERLGAVLPHTLPKPIHQQFVEQNVTILLNRYNTLTENNLNQKQALQFLFDVKFLTSFCIPRESVQLMECSQEICDKLRSKIDPFDLDVFYSHLHNNVKRAVGQSQVILGCLLPSSVHLSNLGIAEKIKDQEQNPSLLALSTSSSTSWFPLLPISVPSQKYLGQSSLSKAKKDSAPKLSSKSSKKSDPTSVMRQSAASLFGGLTTDWFS